MSAFFFLKIRTIINLLIVVSAVAGAYATNEKLTLELKTISTKYLVDEGGFDSSQCVRIEIQCEIPKYKLKWNDGLYHDDLETGQLTMVCV